MKLSVRDSLTFAGTAFLTIGAGLISTAAALVVLGVILLYLGR